MPWRERYWRANVYCDNLASLALMHEVLFNAAGMRLPIVMTVANRALSAPSAYGMTIKIPFQSAIQAGFKSMQKITLKRAI